MLAGGAEAIAIFLGDEGTQTEGDYAARTACLLARREVVAADLIRLFTILPLIHLLLLCLALFTILPFIYSSFNLNSLLFLSAKHFPLLDSS